MGLEFEGDNLPIRPKAIRQPFLVEALINAGVASSEAKANAILFSSSLVCIAACFLVLWLVAFDGTAKKEHTAAEREQIRQQIEATTRQKILDRTPKQ